MKKILYTFILLFVAVNLSAQQGSCGTQYTPDINYTHERLANFLNTEATLRSGADISLPIKIHIIQHDLGFGGINTQTVYNAIDKMNEIYEYMDVEFFVCGPVDYINRTDLQNFDDSKDGELNSNFNVPNVINMYFVSTLTSGNGTPLCGYAYLPWSVQFRDLIMMQNGCTADEVTMAHEMGHYLGLLHTHQPGELVSRSNCSSAGDQCCDTPADPLLGANNVDQNCNYTGNETDAQGNTYSPDPLNIMSYAPTSCPNRMTNQQKDRVRYYASNDRSYLNCTSSSVDELSLSANLSVYPNPAEGKVTISSDVEIVEITILDLSQKVVLNQKQASLKKTQISLDELKSGAYIIQIKYENDLVSTKKLIKS